MKAWCLLYSMQCYCREFLRSPVYCTLHLSVTDHGRPSSSPSTITTTTHTKADNTLSSDQTSLPSNVLPSGSGGGNKALSFRRNYSACVYMYVSGPPQVCVRACVCVCDFTVKACQRQCCHEHTHKERGSTGA